MPNNEHLANLPVPEDESQLSKEAMALLIAMKTYLDRNHGYYLGGLAMPAEFEVNHNITTAHLHELEEHNLIQPIPGFYGYEITPVGVELLTEAGYPPAKNWTVKDVLRLLLDKTIGPILIRLFGLEHWD
ncbi:hypothetical protein KC921_02890 [Candidatus Woesebacteria bacterium]|nr:hypothetical protein [Candidatus Woesebacteria bacterium]